MPLKLDGKLYTITGIGDIMLYPIAKVSQALTDAGFPRDVQTIRKWEIAGIIPKSPFRINGKRLYSQEHIDALVAAIVECNIRAGIPFGDKFKESITRHWTIANSKLLKRGDDSNA